ncbi:hypothetical protein MTR67_031418 [Solanum verrucosum]|uniref:Uncharacterized protein n=1 Tax=Solanum verrucosum TaxID=315347 RepID=A0AAF0U2F6_SOLVR|nr:hypothetical protein MTR67_031418 [Solanum verrucosum]
MTYLIVMTKDMAFPRMPPAQHYKTIFLCPVKNPEPHDNTQFFSCYIVSMLRLMYGDAFEGNLQDLSFGGCCKVGRKKCVSQHISKSNLCCSCEMNTIRIQW